jgi:hypothetical protein
LASAPSRLNTRAAWRARVAWRWSELSLVVVAVPADSNTEDDARALRSSLCAADTYGLRDSAPGLERTFCASFAGCELSAGGDLLRCLAVQVEAPGDLERARRGGAADAFYAAVYGVCLPRNWTLSRLAEECLPAIWPPGGRARNPGALHVLALVTCPLPSQPPLPEGAELVTLTAATVGELSQSAGEAVQHLWPAATPTESLFLRNGLLDMASGRFQDLDAAAEVLAERLELALVRAGQAVRWCGQDGPVLAARRALQGLGFSPGTMRWQPATKIREPDLLGALWEAGLWQPPAADWAQGMTSRGWAALDLQQANPDVERVCVEALRRCLGVERLTHQVLQVWLQRPKSSARVHQALWAVGANGDQAESLAHQIRRSRPVDVIEVDQSDEGLLAAASFGQSVQLLLAADDGSLRPSLARTLWRVVRARNRAAHAQAPTMTQFVALHEDVAAALQGLHGLLA